MFFKNNNILIETSEGYLPFKGVQKIKKNGQIEIYLENGSQLKCSLTHRIMTVDGWKKSIDLKNDDIIICKNEKSKIFFLDYKDGEFEYFDIVGVENEQFYANDILSHNCEFLGSSNTLIHPTVLSRLVYMRPIDNPHEVKIYKHPIKNHVYAITVDVSEGLGMDSSALVVTDCSTVPYEVVATFKDANISQLVFPTLIANIGRYYNDASVLVEINIGSQVVNILHQDLEYENLLKVFTGNKKPQQLSAGFARGIQMGLKMSTQVKQIGCSNLKTLIEGDKLLINDFDTRMEFNDWLESNFKLLFDIRLSYSCTDKNKWPENRTLAVFNSWFDIIHSNLILDLLDEPINII